MSVFWQIVGIIFMATNEAFTNQMVLHAGSQPDATFSPFTTPTILTGFPIILQPKLSHLDSSDLWPLIFGAALV